MKDDALLSTDRLRAASGPGSARAKAAGKKVMERRGELRMSQQRLADGAGSSLQTIFRIERGDLVPREYLRQSIAYTLFVEVDDLWPNPSRQEIHDAGVVVADDEAVA